MGPVVRWVVVVAILGAAWVPAGAAQPGAAAATSVSLNGIPTKVLEESDNALLVPLNLSLEVQNVVCTSDVAFVVATSADLPSIRPINESAPSNATNNATADEGNSTRNATFSATATPGQLTFTLRAGAYGAPGAVGGPYRGELPFTVAIVGENLPNMTDLVVHVGARFPGYTGMGCRGSGQNPAIPRAQADSNFTARLLAPPAPPAPAPTPELPVPPFYAWIALAAALILSGRVRRPSR